MRMFLGTHMPSWLAKVAVPLFVSRRRLAHRRTFPRALGPWALDSGGFTELSMYGGWTVTPHRYVTEVRRFAEEIGRLEWAAPQDWMCEPFMLAKTGLSVPEHQARTVENYLELRDLAPDLPFIPVLQGWTIEDYRRCIDRYTAAGVDLTTCPTVGIGSVCRRQGTSEIAAVVAELADTGIALHGFGVKTAGLSLYRADLVSADSLAWSYGGRRVAGCTPSHKTEANCLPYALDWYARVLASHQAPTARQLTLQF